MSIVYPVSPIVNILNDYFNKPWAEPTEREKELWEMKRKIEEMKSTHEKFLRDREEKERRLLYAIAEKLGIDTENI